jgi:arylsulfatase
VANAEVYEFGEPFPGVIGRTIEESVPAWPERRRAPAGAPNVVWVILDDVGFAQLGCFGAPIDTPNMDALAQRGLRFNNMHATALCSPTRACLMTGRNHHANGLGVVPEMGLGFPGYNGTVPRENGMLPEILRENGYTTLAVGKWHLAPITELSAVGPFDSWALARGFEHHYGFMAGATDQYHPVLVEDNHEAYPPKTYEEGYHLSEDLVDRAIGYVNDLRQVDRAKPFFLYFCPGAGHAPHQVPVEWADRYQGVFEDGWDAYRERAIRRQLELGVIPPGTKLSGHNHNVPDWSGLSAGERRISSRFMEVFAGFMSHFDHQLGRLVAFLDRIGEFDNTLFMLVSDNGASQEGGPYGTFAREHASNKVQLGVEQRLRMVEEAHGPKWMTNYPFGWAWAGNTPFRRWKGETYRGGTSEPFIVTWPRVIEGGGAVVDQYAHVVDMMPTVLDAIGIDLPSHLNGREQPPVHGVSFAHVLRDPKARTKHGTQYFEMLGHRSIHHDGWRAVCPWEGRNADAAGKVFDAATLQDLDVNGWELYHVAEDFSESTDLAADLPAKRLEMITRWYVEAGKYGVLPLDGRVSARLLGPYVGGSVDTMTFSGGTQTIPARLVVKTTNRPWSIVADVEVPERAGGAILNLGGNTGGFVLFMHDGRLRFTYNNLGLDYHRGGSADAVAPGRHELRFDFEPTAPPDADRGRGAPGIGRLSVDGTTVADIDMPSMTPVVIPYTYGLTCGSAGPGRVTDELRGRSLFNGTIHAVTLSARGDFTFDADAEIEVILAEQ